MQQHSGQHILSQAFLRLAEAETVSFHLGDDSVTIDVTADKLSTAQLDSVEDLANQVVTADLSVRAWFPAPDELAKLTLRKTPEVDGPLRVVAIGDFDFNACGGTHVARTGEIGLIKILKTEREKKNIRVEFRCGGRALADYRRRSAIVNQLAGDFTCGYAEVPEAVNKLRAEAQALHRELKTAKETLLAHEAAELLASAAMINDWRIVRRTWQDREVNDLRGLAQRLATAPGTVALLGLAGDKAQLLFARAADVDRDMNALVKTALASLGARGGGSPQMAQGGGVRAELDAVEAALAQAESDLLRW
jgi:alanyl-tRNA synthetase